MGIWHKLRAGETLNPDDRAFLDQRCQERSAKFQKEKADLREGETARAVFYRLKDERLPLLGPVIPAVHAYQSAKRSAPDDRPVYDEDGEALFRAYSLLKWVMRAFEEDDDDREALAIARQCFDLMAPFARSFIPRWF